MENTTHEKVGHDLRFSNLRALKLRSQRTAQSTVRSTNAVGNAKNVLFLQGPPSCPGYAQGAESQRSQLFGFQVNM